MKRVMLTTVVFVVLLMAAVPVAAEPPPLPSSFYGTVRVDGVDVPAGTPIGAWVNGVRYTWYSSIVYPGWGSVYSFNVPGDMLATVDVIEGGKPGDVITFTIGTLPAAQTALWQSGTNVRLDLTATKPVAVEPAPVSVWCRWKAFTRWCR